MKNKTLNVILIAAILSIWSCNSSQKPADTKAVAEEHNDAKFDNTDNQKQDAQFLVDAAEINWKETLLGQLAQQNSQMTDVKEMGIMMEKSHSESMKNLIALAKKKLITIPTSPTDKVKNVYKDLSKKTGKKFDKEYCDMMVSGHKDAIATFEKASKDANDIDVRTWAAETLPILRKHLDYAITCKKKCEKI